jgi:hypothetical protein
MNGAEYVLVGKKVIKAQVLDRSPKSTNGGGISLKLDLGVDDANLHGPKPFMGESHVPTVARYARSQ